MAFSKKELEEIKTKVSIVDLANEYFNVTKKNGYLGINNGNGSGQGDFSSLVIYPATNTFFRNSNRHGGDVISFVLETNIEGIDKFFDAVNFLKTRIDPEFKIEQQYVKKKSFSEMNKEEKINKILESHNLLTKNLVKDDNNKNVIAYLLKNRKIDKSLIYKELNAGHICQAITPNGSKAVAFIGYNYGKLSAVTLRSTNSNSNFKGDLIGCNYDIGWRVYPEINGRKVMFPESKVYCFEGYIDMLSFQTLAKINGRDLSNDIFIACGSANKYKCVVNFYKEGNCKNDLVICFDNDHAGIELGDILAEEVKKLELGNKIDKEFSNLKDWNEDLVKCPEKILSFNDRLLNAVKKSKLQEKNKKIDKNIDIVLR